MILFNFKKQIPFFILISFLFFSCSNSVKNENISKNESHPRIVNIINFIRLSEPREADITEEVLYETVVKQVQLVERISQLQEINLKLQVLMCLIQK